MDHLLDRIVKAVVTPLGVLASISTIIMMLGISAEVVYRNVLGRSIPGMLELSESALVATVFLGLGYAGLTGSHIAVDLLVTRLPARIAHGVLLLSWTLSSAILIWLTYASFGRATDSLARGEARMGLVNWPLWPARWIIVIGFASLLLVAVVNILHLLRGRPLLGEDRPLLHVDEGI